jgi:hypothetical protein
MDLVNYSNALDSTFGASPRPPMALGFTPTTGNTVVAVITELGGGGPFGNITINGLAPYNPGAACLVYFIPAASISGSALNVAWDGGGTGTTRIAAFEVVGALPTYVNVNVAGTLVRNTPAATPPNAGVLMAGSGWDARTVTGTIGTGVVGFPTSVPNFYFGGYSEDLGATGGAQSVGVTLSSATTINGFAVIVLGTAAPGLEPDLTSVNGGSPFAYNATAIPFVGTNLGADEAARLIEWVQGAVAFALTQGAGNATGGLFNMSGYGLGGLARYNVTSAVRVTVETESDEIAVTTPSPPAGYSVVTITSLYPDPDYLLNTSPPLAIGDEVEFQTAGGVNPDGTCTPIDPDLPGFLLRTQNGSGWGSYQAINLTAGDTAVNLAGSATAGASGTGVLSGTIALQGAAQAGAIGSASIVVTPLVPETTTVGTRRAATHPQSILFMNDRNQLVGAKHPDGSETEFANVELGTVGVKLGIARVGEAPGPRTYTSEPGMAFGGPDGPVFEVGAGAPTAVRANGSLYSRTDLAPSGSRLYMRIAGAWIALA